MDFKKEMKLVVKINKHLSLNNGRVSEDEVCKTFNITPSEIPWGADLGWSRCFQSNQEFHLIQSRMDK